MKNQLDSLVEEWLRGGVELPRAVEEFEKRFIRESLALHKGNQSCAAKTLGIHRNTLNRKIQIYKLAANGHRKKQR